MRASSSSRLIGVAILCLLASVPASNDLIARAITPSVQGAAGAPVAADALDQTFAQILKLEDRRSRGGEELTGYLDNERPLAVRVRAALAVGRIGSPVTTPYDLVGALRDKEPELRRMAAFALGEMDDIKAAPLLAGALLDQDAETRAMAAEALGKLKDPGSVSTLMTRLDDPDPHVVGMTLLALWKIDAGELLSRQIEKAQAIYRSSNGEPRWQAAYFLMRAQMGHPDDDRIETALLASSADNDPLIRSYAARGLGASKSAQATQRLMELADDDDWRVQVNSFNGLRTRRVVAEGHARSRWRVYKRALADKRSAVAVSALAALESCGAAEAREYLVKMLGEPRPRFREVAAVALAARDKSAALALVRPLAADPVWSVRARAAEAFIAIGAADTSADLARLAADSDPRVRAAAIDGIARSPAGTPGVAAQIKAALEDEDLFVRAAAMQAVVSIKDNPEASHEGNAGKQGDEVALTTLVRGYQRAAADPQNDARLASLEALAKLGTEAARAEIEKTFDDPDYLVRRRAAELLRDTFHLDRDPKVGEPRIARTDADYLAAVARARQRVTAALETDAGRIEIELFAADAPLTVDNFIRLAREGKFNGLAFHRVVPNFVIQDGDPRGDGNGGPPWQIRCEVNLRRYGAGAVGMALSGKDTGGSQYFITHSPQPHLDGGYTVFGQVLSGQDVVDRMTQGDGVHSISISESP